MLFDEIAELFNQESHRAMARRTGLSRGKVDSLQHGCSVVLDAAFLQALGALGYELRLQRIAPARGGARRPSRAGGAGRGDAVVPRGEKAAKPQRRRESARRGAKRRDGRE